MTDSRLPFLSRHDLDNAKYSPSKTSASDGESPLMAHSTTTTTTSSSRLSQTDSLLDDLTTEQLRMATQRPHVPHLILPSTMNPPPTGLDAVHAPYSNYTSSYPHYYAVTAPVATSPVLREHPVQYPYPSIHAATAQQQQYQQQQQQQQQHRVYTQPPMHAMAYHPARRDSISVYYNYDYAGMQSPVSPYAYHYPAFVHPTPASPPQFPPQPPVLRSPPSMPSPPPVQMHTVRQSRALSSSQQMAPSLTKSATANTNDKRRRPVTLYASASAYGHQLQRNNQRRDPRDLHPHPTLHANGQSGALADFKNHKFKRFELKDVFGHCVEFSTDQHGSRFIQQKLDTANPDERQAVFDEVIPAGNFSVLAFDVFGNYVIQKLFEFGSPLHRRLLCSAMEGHVLQLSLDMYGCRVVQKALDCGTPQQQASIVSELNGHVLQCVKDANGNHVIQKILELVPAQRNVLLDAFSGNVRNLASHPYGCRVLQRSIEYAAPEETASLLEELHQNSSILMQDQFGNYVVQYILEHGAPAHRDRMIDSIRGNVLSMARHKFASNVCEKALLVANAVQRRALVEEMLTPMSNGTSSVSIMMKDQYANYVLQKAITLSEGEMLQSLVGVVIDQLSTMRRPSSSASGNGANGKQIASIERLLKDKGFTVDKPAVKIPSTAAGGSDGTLSGTPTP